MAGKRKDLDAALDGLMPSADTPAKPKKTKSASARKRTKTYSPGRPKGSTRVQLTTHIDIEQRKELERIAKREDMSMAWIIRRALAEYIKRNR